jgi:hypothetical protein
MPKLFRCNLCYYHTVQHASCCSCHPSTTTTRYGGTGDAIRRIWREEGAGGFFKGMNAKLLQTALNAALMLSIKEQVYTGTAAAVNAVGKLSHAKQQLQAQAREGGVLPVVQAGAQTAMTVPVVMKKPTV